MKNGSQIMEKISIPWGPCFCDPWLGVAHFDGITIRADPITSARPDRVLPTIIDEQIALCRYIASREKNCKGLRAIDLGSGSGVLSIYAAMLGMNVKGVDCVDRAIDYAIFNKSRQDPSALPANGGSVNFVKGDVCELEEDTAYDVVVMNPPFSPTIGVNAPKCTHGGDSGQEVFYRFLAKASQLLRPGGRCYAVHLLETDRDGTPFPDFISCFDEQEWSTLRKVSIRLPRKRSSEFLKQQYSWSEDLNKSGSILAAHLDRAERLGIYYDMVIIEVHRTKSVKQHRMQITSAELTMENYAFPTDWGDRTLLHNQVCLNSTWQRYDKNGVFQDNMSRAPSGSVLLQTTSIGHATPGSADRNQFPRPLRMLDEWLGQNTILGGDADADIKALMVEAVPWSHRGLSDIKSETTLWVRDSYSGCAETALNRILQQIKQFNQDKRSIFRHLGLSAPVCSHWEISATRTINDSAALTRSDEHSGVAVANFPSICAQVRAAYHAHLLEKFSITRRSNLESNPLLFEDDLIRALREFSGILRDSSAIPAGNSTCYFAFLPLPLPTPEHRSEGEVGSIYVYAWSQSPWNPFLESRVLDVARVASAFYGHQFTNDSAEIIKASDIGTILHAAQHELARIIGMISENISQQAAVLIRRLFRLHLELDTMSTRGEPPEYWAREKHDVSLVSRAAAIEAFVIHKALTKTPTFTPHKATAEDILVFDERARSIVQAPGMTGWATIQSAWSAIPDEQVMQKHGFFRAAIIAAVRNALHHTLDKDKKYRPIISLEPGRLAYRDRVWPALLIVNSYESKSEEKDAYNYYRSKVEDSNEVGTARVLAHYARLIVDDDSISSVPPPEFLTPCGPEFVDEQIGWRHKWTSIVPLPAFSEVSSQ